MAKLEPLPSPPEQTQSTRAVASDSKPPLDSTSASATPPQSPSGAPQPSSESSPAASSRGDTPPLANAPFDAARAKQHQEAWAKHLGVAVEVTNSIGMKLMLIPPGEFMMGSPDSDRSATSNEKPQHRVRITKPSYLGAHEVTLGQFRQFVHAKRYKTDAEKDRKGGTGFDSVTGKTSSKPEYTWCAPGFTQTDEHPVGMVSWNDAMAFSSWLSAKEGHDYRLPTEAEWEQACRAGTTTKYWHGDDPEGLAPISNVADAALTTKYRNWKGISASDGHVFTAPVGLFRPNAFGLYDLHGNVWEWCAGWLTDQYDPKSPADDPEGPDVGRYRMLRGGSWASGPLTGHSAHRHGGTPSCRYFHFGFRVARSLAAETIPRASASTSIAPGGKEAIAARVESPTSPAAVAAENKRQALPAVKTQAKPRAASTSNSAPTPILPPRAVAPFDATKAREHQQAWAKHSRVPVEMTNSIGMKLVLIPPDEFLMGSRDSDTTAHGNTKPQHRVRITKPFYLGKYEVTQDQYEQVMGTNPSNLKGDRRRPVEMVTWQDAIEFCRRLSQKERVTYRLPTEAEWEYACRAGSTTKYSFGDDQRALGDYAWSAGNAGGQTHPVGLKNPNAWQIYDMHGNVWEWCADWYSNGYHAASPQIDPIGSRSGAYRVLRGGSRSNGPVPSAFRYGDSPGGRANNRGLRLVRTP